MNNFDPQKRSVELGKSVIRVCKKIPKNEITSGIISQVVRLAGSIGANYCEASNASSRKDFRNKLYISKKEAQETKHWLELLSEADQDYKSDLRKLWQEAHELTLILHKSLKTLESNND